MLVGFGHKPEFALVGCRLGVNQGKARKLPHLGLGEPALLR